MTRGQPITTHQAQLPAGGHGAAECWRVPVTMRWCADGPGTVRGLDDLYQRAKENPWNPAELDWESTLDLASPLMSRAWCPYECLPLFRRLSAAQRRTFRTHALAQQLSQLLHGAQGNLLMAAAVTQGVADAQAKCCAAAQVMDEARHLEAYDRYLQRLEARYPALPWLSQLTEDSLFTGDVHQTIAGGNLIAKGLTMGAVQRMYREIQEPLLKTLTFHVMRDVSRHVSFGRVYLGAATAAMRLDEREELAQFVLDTVRHVQAGQAHSWDSGFLSVLSASGIDPDDFHRDVEAAAPGLRPRPAPGQVHALEDLPVPALIRAGVVTARTQALFEASGIPLPADLATTAHASAGRADAGGRAVAG